MPCALVACLGPSCALGKPVLSTLGMKPQVVINVIRPPSTPYIEAFPVVKS